MSLLDPFHGCKGGFWGLEGGTRNEPPHLTANLSLCHSATVPPCHAEAPFSPVACALPSPEGLALTKIPDH
jgi:hypothetical protein